MNLEFLVFLEEPFFGVVFGRSYDLPHGITLTEEDRVSWSKVEERVCERIRGFSPTLFSKSKENKNLSVQQEFECVLDGDGHKWAAWRERLPVFLF